MKQCIEIILLGQNLIGKTSILKVLADNDYNPQEQESTRNESIKRFAKYESHAYPVQLRNPYKPLQNDYYKKQYFYIVAFSLVNIESFTNAQNLIEAIQQENPDAIISLIGTKSDLVDESSYRDDRVEKVHPENFASSKNITYIATSAKNKTNIDQITETIAQQILKNPKIVLMQKLQSYINEITELGVQHGFKTFKKPQGMSRHANVLLANKLIEELKTDKNIEDIFKKDNINDLRSAAVLDYNKSVLTYNQIRMFPRMIPPKDELKLSFFGKNTVRGRVKDIIEEAQHAVKNMK